MPKKAIRTATPTHTLNGNGKGNFSMNIYGFDHLFEVLKEQSKKGATAFTIQNFDRLDNEEYHVETAIKEG